MILHVQFKSTVLSSVILPMKSLFNTYKNMKKTFESGQSLTEIAVRWRRNAGQFKTGTLVGTDEYGNKYYEDTSDENINNISGMFFEDYFFLEFFLLFTILGRDRWVEFPNNIKERSASQVPPEWHSWLHYTSDIPSPVVWSLSIFFFRFFFIFSKFLFGCFLFRETFKKNFTLSYFLAKRKIWTKELSYSTSTSSDWNWKGVHS